MELNDQWQKTAVPLRASSKALGRCKLSFGIFLALLVGTGTVLASIAVGALLLTAIQDGNTVFAGDIQVVTSANMVQLLGTLAIIPIENLAVLFSVLSGELRVDGHFCSPTNDQFRRILFGQSLAGFDGVFAGFPDGKLTGYRGSAAQKRLQFLDSTLNTHGQLSLSIYETDNIGLPLRTVILVVEKVSKHKGIG